MGAFVLVCLSIAASVALSSGGPAGNLPTETVEAAPNVDTQKCMPGSSHFDGCNTCVCLKDGSGESCTKKICEPPTPTSNPLGEPCNPGEYIGWKGCIPCQCTLRGSEEVCTKKMCDGGQPQRYCKPGQSEFDGCNTCWCNREGTSKECTKQICD